jgi:hypothetical protein
LCGLRKVLKLRWVWCTQWQKLNVHGLRLVRSQA